MSTTMTIRLEQLADATQRSKSFLAVEAIRDFVELNEWQIQVTKQALKEANNEDFASEQEVKQIFAKWGVDVNSMAPQGAEESGT